MYTIFECIGGQDSVKGSQCKNVHNTSYNCIIVLWLIQAKTDKFVGHVRASKTFIDRRNFFLSYNTSAVLAQWNTDKEFVLCDSENKKEIMSGPQCCSNPPALNPSSGSGHVEKFGGFNSYVTGSPDSKLAILLVHDGFGTYPSLQNSFFFALVLVLCIFCSIYDLGLFATLCLGGVSVCFWFNVYWFLVVYVNRCSEYVWLTDQGIIFCHFPFFPLPMCVDHLFFSLPW